MENFDIDAAVEELLANYKLDGRTEFRGLQISIENDKGSTRSGVDKSGKPWKVTMTYPYGYIRMTEGVDGDHVDCFLGGNEEAKNVYVIHTQQPTNGQYDEDKCMLGFDSAEEAKAAFLENYNDPKFFGSMDTVPFEKFKEKVLATKENPKKLSAYGTSEGVQKSWDTRGRTTKLDVTEEQSSEGKGWMWLYGDHNGQQAARILLSPEGKGSWAVRLIQVHEDQRGKGFATEMYRHAIDYVKKRNGNKLTSDPEGGTKRPVQEIWRKLGGTRQREMPRFQLQLSGNSETICAHNVNEGVGTKKTGYALPEMGPFECEHCVHVSEKGTRCDHPEVIADPDVPKAPDQKLAIVDPHACCNEFHPLDEMEAYGTSEGAEKGWDTRGRGKKEEKDYTTEHGVHVGIFDRPEEAGKGVIPINKFFHNPPPPESERVKIADKFNDAVREGHKELSVHELVPMQQTLVKERMDKAAVHESPSPVSVFHHEGNHYLMDGHHRVAADYIQEGKDKVKAVVFRLPADELAAAALFHDVKIVGFSKPEEEMVRATVSRVPPELMKNVLEIKADPSMQPKHGRYDPDTQIIHINPLIFKLRQRFGKGPGWIFHVELTMVHEFGHSIYTFLPEKLKDEWREISGWMVGTKEGQAEPYEEKRPGWPHHVSKWTHKTNVRFTRHYAERNDDEDFADCFAFYFLSKPHQMAPEKRQFIANVIANMVHRYPKALIEGPAHAYGERDLKYRQMNAEGYMVKTLQQVVDSMMKEAMQQEKKTPALAKKSSKQGKKKPVK